MSGHPRLLLIVISAAAIACAIPAHGQGRIDPELPPAPLTHTRTLLIFSGVDTVKDPNAVLPPLTARQKYWIFWHRTVDPSLPVEALFFATISQSTNYSPRYGKDWAAFPERFGSIAGSIASSNFFSDAFFPSLFHQDPRYFRKGSGSIASRLLYALKSEFVVRNDSGTMTVNSSGLLGFGFSTALSNAWGPRSGITLSSNLQRFGVKLGISAIINIVREFGSGRDGPP